MKQPSRHYLTSFQGQSSLFLSSSAAKTIAFRLATGVSSDMAHSGPMESTPAYFLGGMTKLSK